MRAPAGSARRWAATCSFSRRSSASASNSSLRARRYSLDSSGKWTFGSRSTSRHLFMSRGLPLRAIVSILSYAPNSLPCGDTLAGDIPSFGFAGQPITAACSVMLAGPTDRIFTDRIFKPLFYERRYIATRQACQCTAELSKSCGLGWQGRGRRRSQVRAGLEIAPLGRTQSERRRLALAGGFFKAPQFGQCSMSMSKTRLSSLANSCAPARPARECLRLRSRRRALPERETILLRNLALGAKTP